VSTELDALLQRRLGQLAAMAEYGADAPDAGAHLAAIETASRDTLIQMRALVGVLRDDGDPSPTSPQPTLTHLETLLARAGGSSEPVSASPTGSSKSQRSRSAGLMR
jgi:hypothetical protein